jgi:hypothetical protein
VISLLIDYYGGRGFSESERSLAVYKLMPKIDALANCAASSKDKYLREHYRGLLKQRARYKKYQEEQGRQAVPASS